LSCKSHCVVLVEGENYRKIDSVEAGSKWMGGSFLEPPIGVAVKWAFYDVRYPGIVIHPSVVWFFGLKFQRITIQ